ncbi:MAG: ATP-binding cassette domain-containing protein, partial [Mesorhizobium sp.]
MVDYTVPGAGDRDARLRLQHDRRRAGRFVRGSRVIAALLKVADLTVVHDGDGGERTLLDAVSLDLAPGEVLGLVGESGSGKSLL